MPEQFRPTPSTERTPKVLSAEEFDVLYRLGVAPTPNRPKQQQKTVAQPRPQHSGRPPVDPVTLERALRVLKEEELGRSAQMVQHSATVIEGNRSRQVETDTPDKKRSKKISRKTIGLIVAGTLFAGAATAGALHYNNGGFNDFFGSDDANAEANSDLGNGMDIEELNPLGLQALKDTQCYLPGAVLMILSVEGYSSMVPTLPGTEEAPYMNKSAQKEIGASDEVIKELAPYNTKDGYNHATLNELPLYVTACSIGSGAVKEISDGSYEITRSLISMKFQDPNRLFDSTELVWTKKQDESAEVDTDPELGEYMTVPMSMYVGQREGDDAYNKAAAALNESMKDPLQLSLILAAMQTDAVRQIDNTEDGEENINYPSGVTNLQDAMDAALLTRLGISHDAKITWVDDYPVSMDVARVNGKPVTDGNKLANMRLDPFVITNVDIAYGSPTEPKPRPKPTPTPTATAEANE